MGNYKTRGASQTVLLDNHLATGTENTYTYTATLDMKNTYRYLQIIINGSVTATCIIQLKLSAGTDYNTSSIFGISGTPSHSTADATAYSAVITNGLLTSALPFGAEVKIFLNDAVDKMELISSAFTPSVGHAMYSAEAQASTTEITSIELRTSTSTWIAGTEISIYGIKR